MKSPLCELLLGLGGQYPEPDRSGTPRHFGEPDREYDAACHTAAIVDRSLGTKIELRGRDRARFLHNLCTNDIKGLPVGQACEAYLTNVQGRILAYVRVLAGAESHWIDTVPGAAPALLAHLNHYLISEQVELLDRTSDFAQIWVVGPQAASISAEALGSGVPQLPDQGHTTTTIAGTSCQLIRNDSLCLPAYEFRVPVEQAAAAWEAIWQAGRPIGLNPMGDEAFEVLRIEAGLPIYGADIDDSNFPQEVRRDERTISYTKGCYLGQETVHRIWTMGHVNRYLVGLEVPGSSASPARGSVISAADKQIGKITSGVYSPALNCPVALGYVRRGFEKPGGEVTVDPGNTSLRASIRELPFRTTVQSKP
ncbi:MAG: aminomethyl transferase family protein [Planctomycetes bacterium]|nr:aminomethyl transferase family protein [Planctomycetota bacterium]